MREGTVVKQEKATLSMPDELKLQARAKAILEGSSLSEVVRELLKAWIEGSIELPPPEPDRSELGDSEE